MKISDVIKKLKELQKEHGDIEVMAYTDADCHGYYDTFIEDKEVVLYTGFDEAIDKISYYLAHEEKRAKIVESGRKKVYEKCNMTDRIKEILSISFNE